MQRGSGRRNGASEASGGDRSGGNGDGRRRPRRVRAVALALLVVSVPVVAGCSTLSDDPVPVSAPTVEPNESVPTPETTDGDTGATNDRLAATTVTETSPERTRIQRPGQYLDSKLETPPETVFRRVERIAGAEAFRYPEVKPYPTSSVVNRSEPFFRLLVGHPDDPERVGRAEVANLAYLSGELQVFLRETHGVPPEEVEAWVALAFARQVHYDNGWVNFSKQPYTDPLFQVTTRWLADAYARQYLGQTYFEPQPYEEANVTDYEWAYIDGRRYYIHQWVTDRADSPADIPAVYEVEYPATSEQLLHDTDDPGKELTLELDTPGRWYWTETGVDKRGELGTRTILRTHLNATTARRAAEGWGQDRYAAFKLLRGDSLGAVWVHRWDTPADADEFARAMRTYMERRHAETEEDVDRPLARSDAVRYEVRRPAENVTVLVVSDGTMLDVTSVSYARDRAYVTVGE